MQALILDFGGVISKTLFETHAQTEAALGLRKGTLTWRGPFDPASDPLWRDLCDDKISERDYWLVRTKEVGVMIGQNWQHMSDFLKAVRGNDPMQIIRSECLEVISLVRQSGKKLAILSNELDLFYGADFRKKLPFMKKFDTIIDATYTKILKPDSRSYQLVVDALACAPSECVFVDDQWRNIQGAQAFGMKTVCFDVLNPQASYTEGLAKLGVAK